MHDTVSQMILILHDSGVLWKLHILDREHVSCPVLLHDSNVVSLCFLHSDKYPNQVLPKSYVILKRELAVSVCFIH